MRFYNIIYFQYCKYFFLKYGFFVCFLSALMGATGFRLSALFILVLELQFLKVVPERTIPALDQR